MAAADPPTGMPAAPLLDRTIVVIGPTGAGKSVTGSALAKLLARPFVDSDHVLAAQYGLVPLLYARVGEAVFRRLEASTVAAILSGTSLSGTSRSGTSGPLVLSLGGGAVMDATTRQLLGDLTVVWLDTDLRTVLPRLQAQASRPLFHDDLSGRWQSNADARTPFYAEAATLRIDARSGSPEELAEEIRSRLAGDHC
jgi:shikimate kinase